MKLFRRGNTLSGPQELLEEVDRLDASNRAKRDVELERRILRLRHRAGIGLVADPDAAPRHADPDHASLGDRGVPPEARQDELTAGLLRAAILSHGCLLVRGLLDRDRAEAFASEIDTSFKAREGTLPGGPPSGLYEEFVPDPPYEPPIERPWIADTGGLLAADSPKLMFEMLDAFERAGLRELIAEYLGERSTISLQKCTLRKAEPTVSGLWHQDGAFLGEVRSLNVWLSLSRCGDLAPGLDIVPRRLELVETGTDGAFSNSVAPRMVEQVAGEGGIVRPIFEPGDALIFDDLFLHSTASEPEMPNPRYAVESWFFGPAGFPDEYTPFAF